MKNFLSQRQIEQTLTLTEVVAKDIMTFYQSDYTTYNKVDNSPVTEADIKASQLLEKGLPKISNFPVLSEENTPKNGEWMNWQTYWMIDPIDGTKHFINGTGDFCICIALIHENKAVFGLINAPTTKTTWFAQKGDTGVNKLFAGQVDQPHNVSPALMTVALSASYLSKKMNTLLNVFSEFQWYNRGSALKYIDIIEGKASIYPKIRDTYEWDSAAGQCLLECAGGEVINFLSGKPLYYGHKPSLLNPHFLSYKGLSRFQLDDLLTMYQAIHQ